MGRLRSLLIPGVDKRLLVRDAVNVMPDLARRRFITGGASLAVGGVIFLLGQRQVPVDAGRRAGAIADDEMVAESVR